MVTRHLALVGATASGKSALAFDLACASEGAIEIVSADSMLVYQGMDIGTAKPTAEERAVVRHHVVDVAGPWEDYHLARFQRDVAAALSDIERRGRRALLVGGTGLYVRAVVDGLSVPPVFPALRAALEGEADAGGGAAVAAMHLRLAGLDPVAASRMEPSNRRRIVRALEVTLGAGRPFSSFGQGLEHYGAPAIDVSLVGIRWPGPIQRSRIAGRVEQMLAAGLVEEVRGLAADPRGLSRTARQALGYKEVLDHFAGDRTLDEAAELVVRRTRGFARRQRAWFERDPRIRWIEPAGAGEGEADPNWRLKGLRQLRDWWST